MTDHVIVPRDVDVIYREHMLDPLAVLPWLAAATSRISLGTSVIILPYRSPLPVAKLLASVDVLSGGRLIVGAAIGWMEGEFEALGVPFKERVSRSEEALELFRAVWTQEQPEITTARHQLPERAGVAHAAAEAAPAHLDRRQQRGRLSSRGPVRRRLARDVLDARRVPPGQAGRDALLARGRPGRAIPCGRCASRSSSRASTSGPWIQKFLRGRHAIRGTLKQVAGQLAEYQRLGVSHMALEVSYSVYPAILETIDLLAEEVKPFLDRGSYLDRG